MLLHTFSIILEIFDLSVIIWIIIAMVREDKSIGINEEAIIRRHLFSSISHNQSVHIVIDIQ